MWYSVSHEALVFAVMAAGGVAAGIMFDIMRALRSGFSSGRVLTNIIDTLFWIFAGGVTVYLLVRFNDGILRMYEFLGMFLGGFLYFCTFSMFIKKLFELIFKILHKFIILICKIVLTPLVFLYKILLGLINGLRTFVVNMRKKKDGEKKEEEDRTGEKRSV